MKQIILVAVICLSFVGTMGIISNIPESTATPEVIVVEDTEPEPSVVTEPTTVTTTTKKKVKKKTTVKKVATSNKDEYKAYAKSVGSYDDTQMQCLDLLWTHESGWNPNSVNKSSGACGIPQALPCNKISKQQGSNDWKAQIRWGINYISGRYGSPCSAWNHFQKKHWY